jgi:hypothetical protein
VAAATTGDERHWMEGVLGDERVFVLLHVNLECCDCRECIEGRGIEFWSKLGCDSNVLK